MGGPETKAAHQGGAWEVRGEKGQTGLEERWSAKGRTKAGLGWAGWEAEEVRGWKILSQTD